MKSSAHEFLSQKNPNKSNSKTFEDMGLPLVMMGRGEWQQGVPEMLEKAMSQTGAATMLLWAVIISSAFVLFALSLSFYLLFEHLSGYNEPKVLISSNLNAALSSTICHNGLC